MLNRAVKIMPLAVLAVFCLCDPVFGQGALEGYEVPSDVDVAMGWEPYVLTILSLGLICVCAFKKAKRTHLD